MNKTAIYYGTLVTIIILALIISSNLNKTPVLTAKFADDVTNQILSQDSTNSFGDNLKVLRGIHSRDQLVNVMRGFTEALGVKCDFCHNQDNFSSDEKIQKMTARVMIKMVANIDGNYLAGSQTEKVTCFTCHRGASIPKLVAEK
ncbi:MAG: c-type cytochrome [Candidatus Kryptoniota bacterium]